MIHRPTLKHNQPHTEINDEISTNRQGNQLDINEYIPGKDIYWFKQEIFVWKSSSDPSPKPLRSTGRTTLDKDQRVTPTPQSKGPILASPKSLATDLHKPIFSGANDEESSSNVNDPIYGNVQGGQRTKKKETYSEDEGDSIEHDLLKLVQEEQQRDLPPELPMKRRAATTSEVTTIHEHNNNLDVNIGPTMKLVHPGKKKKGMIQFCFSNVFLFS